MDDLLDPEGGAFAGQRLLVKANRQVCIFKRKSEQVVIAAQIAAIGFEVLGRAFD